MQDPNESDPEPEPQPLPDPTRPARRGDEPGTGTVCR